jgi:quinol monooxygenase YgiN
MLAAIRKYRFNSSASAEIAKHIQEGLVPLLRKTPGFVSYYWVVSADGYGTSISVFESQAGVDKSVQLSAKFVKKHLANILGSPPEIIIGEIQAHSQAQSFQI